MRGSSSSSFDNSDSVRSSLSASSETGVGRPSADFSIANSMQFSHGKTSNANSETFCIQEPPRISNGDLHLAHLMLTIILTLLSIAPVKLLQPELAIVCQIKLPACPAGDLLDHLLAHQVADAPGHVPPVLPHQLRDLLVRLRPIQRQHPQALPPPPRPHPV